MIKYYNRKEKSYEIEKVAGDKYLNWIYSSPIGMKLLEMIVKKKLFSSFYGFYVNRGSSRKKINNFIKEFNLDPSSFEKQANDFTSFNDFFYRKLKKEARPICIDSNALISLGDGKLLAYENINLEKLVQVKSFTYSLKELIKDEVTASKFEGGTCLILRLCPTDYHRFHFVDSGTCSKEIKIKGAYYSVNPIALDKVQKLFCENKREWSMLHSDNFKDILYVEVGATCVGSIVQSYEPNKRVEKGEEKGYFKFGGSTVILFFEPNTIKIDDEIINQTNLGFETYVLMGEKIGNKL